MYHFPLLTLRTGPKIPIDLEGILPETLRGLSEIDIAIKPIRQGNRVLKLGELFDVMLLNCEELLEETLDIIGDCSEVTSIGAGMTRGSISVLNAGMHVGAKMAGGSICIINDVGDWLGAEMTGGHISVGKNAGSQVGAAYHGGPRGMSGGKIHICGNAGEDIGLRMRRGKITVAGNTGAFTGAAMIAGTIEVYGEIGDRAGAGMKRGTIISHKGFQSLSPGFVFACEYEPAYLRVLNEYKRWFLEGRARKEYRGIRMVRCYRGDLLTGGRGEIWEVTA